MLEYLVIAIALSACPTRAEDGEFYNVPNDTTTCKNDLIHWCDGMEYPQEGAGMSIISVTIIEPTGYCRALCAADYSGTNCTKNGLPWFSCSQDNQFFYKGKQLREDSDDGTDNDTCNTASKAFNDLNVKNLVYDNTTIKREMEKEMESFFREMANMHDEIEGLKAQIANMFDIGYLYGSGDNWRPSYNIYGQTTELYQLKK